MEEFIKEHENEFVEYINFEEKTKEELSELNKNIEDIRAVIKSKSFLKGITAENEIKQRQDLIEQKSKEIYSINEKITSLGIGLHVNEIKESNLSDKEQADFNIKIEIERLKSTKKKLEDEIQKIKSQIIEIAKNSNLVSEKQEEFNSIQKRKEEINSELEKRRSVLRNLIKEKIEVKEKALDGIYQNRNEIVEKSKDEIKEIEKAIDAVSVQNFVEKELNELKQRTLTRLRNKIQNIREKVNKDIHDFDSIKSTNIEELNNLNQLLENINNGNNIVNLIREILNIDNKDKTNEDLSEYYDEKCKEGNVTLDERLKQKETPKKQWKKDIYGHYYLAEEEEKEENSFIDRLKDNFSKISNTAKKFGKKLKEIFGFDKQEEVLKRIQETSFNDDRKKLEDKYKTNVDNVDPENIPITVQKENDDIDIANN